MEGPVASAVGGAEADTAGLSVRLRRGSGPAMHVELDCAPGELVALVGPSGAGKTTVLRAIAGLVDSVEGVVRCGGRTWMDSDTGVWLRPQQRRVGLVFQDYALFPHLTAAGNVAVALRGVPRSGRTARARELLERVHLSGLEDRYPAQLSGGQRQRVALARALAREPDVLLLDEPFAAVDQVTRRKLQRELAVLRRSLRMPIVLVTHDLQEAVALADRMVVLYRGRTLQAGPPAQVMNRPELPLVARLMDQANLFEGTVLAHERDATLLAWREYTLEARLQPRYPPGARVAWMIPPAQVVLHRRDRPSRGERENPLPGRVADIVEMGETAMVTMAVGGREELALHFSVSAHAARRNRLARGAELRVSLLAEGIHLMPPQD